MPITLTPLEIETLLDEQEAKEHQDSVYLARRYYKGDHDVYLNDRALEYLGVHKENPFRFNVCKTIVGALADEINILGYATDESTDEDPDQETPVADWLEDLLERNKFDALQKKTHRSALSDSESFVIVEWDPIQERVTLTHNPYFIDTNNGGDGMGVYFLYENDDPDQEPIAAVKRWVETIRTGPLSAPLSRLRMTIYFPDHFERWVYDNAGQWEHFNEELGVNDQGEIIYREWYLDNIDPGTGEALGIPVFHFMNEDLTPEHWDAIPMQDAINKTLVDVLAAGDLTAFQSYFGFGFYPTTDGQAPKADRSNLMKMGPAQFNGTMKSSDQASLQVIQGQDSTFLMNQFKDLVLSTAQMTDTPASRFIITGAIASDKTIKEQERGLRKKGATRRKIFSPPWEGVINMARKLSNVFGSAGLSEEVTFSPIWEHTETLDELAEKKQTLEIPIEQIWREAGYSQTQIDTMKKDSSYRVEFERKLWEGYQAASLNGIPLRLYLKRVGLPEEEIEEIEREIANQAPIPAVGL